MTDFNKIKQSYNNASNKLSQELYNILLIEDDPIDAKLLHRSIANNELAKFTIDHVTNLTDAMRQLTAYCYDLILLDLNLPDSDPKSVTEKILSQYTHAPLVVVSGYSDECFAVTAVRQGAQDYISKNDLGLKTNSIALKLIHAIDRHHLAQAVKKAKKADKAKSEFLAMMSHEVRTPINGVIGMSHLALQESLPPKARVYIEHIYESAEQLMRVTNDILDTSRIEAGKLELHPIDFNLFKQIKTQINAVKATLSSRPVMIDFNYDQQLAHHFQGDRIRIKQVLGNLIHNACKNTVQGKICVNTKYLSSNNGKTLIRFEVEDTGVGIEQEVLKKLFQPFTQAKNSNHANGSGLGLHIVKSLVKLMGGRCGATSRIGQGSLFWFEISLLDEEKKPLKDLPLPQSLPSQKTNGPVLIGEDNLVNQIVAKQLLKKLGISADVAKDGVEVMDFLKHKHYELVLLDCHMPRLDGYSASKMIRRSSDPRIAATPIIAVTANAMENDKEKCIQAGMNDYLSKPFNINQLTDVVAKWLKKPSSN